MSGQSTPVERMLRLQQLERAINELPTLTADVILEDDEGGRYDLVRSLAIGAKTDDPGLVLRIRRTR
jgi:hypothetical protein